MTPLKLPQAKVIKLSKIPAQDWAGPLEFSSPAKEDSSRNLFDFFLLLGRLMNVASIELLHAAAFGDLNRVRSLLAQGVDVNSTNKANQTAIMLAAAFKRADIVKYLVAAGADVEIQDELGLTAFDWAQQDTAITRLFQVADPIPVASEETVDQTLKRFRSIDLTSAATAPARAPAPIVEPESEFSSVDSSLPPALPTSPVIRTLFRASIVVLLLAAGFVSYHLVTSVLNTRTPAGVQPGPTLRSTTPTKKAPVVGGALAGAELFLPDAEYPPDATVASGNVTIGIQVSRKGIVVKAEALDGDESLRDAAERAALGSAFAPEKLPDNGSLIDGTITYNFLKTNDAKAPVEEFGFATDANTPSNITATAGGPLAGAERKLVIPKIPRSMRVERESATVVVRVNRAGRVMSWRPLDDDTRLRAALIRAARNSTFDPEKLPGEDQVVGIITYRFQ